MKMTSPFLAEPHPFPVEEQSHTHMNDTHRHLYPQSPILQKADDNLLMENHILYRNKASNSTTAARQSTAGDLHGL